MSEQNMQKLYSSKNTRTYRFIKRCFDILVSACALLIVGVVTILFLPFYLFGSNKGPIFYKQERIGQFGKPFYIYKFRSMIVHADEILKSDSALYDRFKKNGYKLPDGEDPRITKFGNFIRKTSLDEIPQFANIFIGNMSMIGPRPIVKSELQEYGDNASEFLSVKPGAMGYWQEMGRSTITYPKRCGIELYYVRHASLTFDAKIFVKSIISIFKRKGAY